MKSTAILSTFALLTCAVLCATVSTQVSSETPECKFVYLRFYHIARLEHTIHLLKKIETAHEGNPELFSTLAHGSCETHLEHPRIMTMVRLIQETDSLEPLYVIWNDIIHYKYIHEISFMQDFVKAVLAVSKSFVLPLTPQDRQSIFDTLFTKSMSNHSTETLLATLDIFIDEYTTYRSSGKFGYTVSELQIYLFKNLHADHANAQENYTEKISQRLYLVKRLTRSSETLLECLKKMGQNNAQPLISSDEIEQVGYKNQRIKKCIHALQQGHNQYECAKVWKECQQFRYIHDTSFMREYAQMIHSLLKKIILSEVAEHRTSLATLYAEIEALPLEDILHATDLLIEQMPLINEHYEFNTDMSWRAWLRKYWWAPPMLAASLALRVYLMIRLKNYIQGKMGAPASTITPAQTTNLPQPAIVQNQ